MLVVKTLLKRLPTRSVFNTVPKRKLHPQLTRPLPKKLSKTEPLWMKVAPYWVGTAITVGLATSVGGMEPTALTLLFPVGATLATTVEYIKQIEFEKIIDEEKSD